MPKQLNCGQVMPGCTTVIEGHDEAEVLAKAAQHARD
jgi:predicted small metal-binding protein